MLMTLNLCFFFPSFLLFKTERLRLCWPQKWCWQIFWPHFGLTNVLLASATFLWVCISVCHKEQVYSSTFFSLSVCVCVQWTFLCVVSCFFAFTAVVFSLLLHWFSSFFFFLFLFLFCIFQLYSCTVLILTLLHFPILFLSLSLLSPLFWVDNSLLTLFSSSFFLCALLKLAKEMMVCNTQDLQNWSHHRWMWWRKWTHSQETGEVTTAWW